MLRFVSIIRVRRVSVFVAFMTTGAMMLVKLFGAIWPFKFMAFAGNTEETESGQQQGK